jgi:cobalt-zinc-cadmium efflux system membrane fusion protein
LNQLQVSAIATLAAALALACNKAPAPEPPREAVTFPSVLHVDPALFAAKRIESVSVERRAPLSELKVAGEVRAGQLSGAEVGALTSGRISSVLVAEGSKVERGQILAWIDAPDVARATADVLRARARATSASNRLTRQVELDAGEATSKNALDEARADAQVARADLLATRTVLRSLGGVEPPPNAESTATSVSARVALRAPAPGVVSRRDAVVGGFASPERTLFWLAGDEQALVLARVPEGLAAPTDGERATIVSRASGASCDGTVRGRLGVIDSATRTFAVRLEPEATCGKLVTGTFVDVSFRRVNRQGGAPLVVPRDAVVDVHGAPFAFVIGDTQGEILVRPVRVLDEPGPDLVIESGLTERDKVVRTGTLLLKGELLRAELTGS